MPRISAVRGRPKWLFYEQLIKQEAVLPIIGKIRRLGGQFYELFVKTGCGVTSGM